MIIPDWIIFSFIFVWGCCIGSFLNVVIYRLPRDKSIVSPPSACPGCGKHIRFYDNIPLISWLLLGRKCRYCKAPISPRYFIIELFTGLVFLGLFILYFRSDFLTMPSFLSGGWLIYLLHIIMLGAFIAASAIDLELWIIPLIICWFVTAAGFIGSSASGYIIDQAVNNEHWLLPAATSATGSLALGATIGLIISMILLATGLLKRSYELPQQQENPEKKAQEHKSELLEKSEIMHDEHFNHRLESIREIIFLLPIIALSVLAYWIFSSFEPASTWWDGFSQKPAVSGLLGSIWGYFIGCGIVWGVRIFGTLAFGKEAMGLGDVHLMGAAGAVIGPVFVVIAFFVAPFFGLGWAGFQMFFKKIRQIPYGPFLSLGVLVVMILRDWIIDRLLPFYY